MKQDRWVKLAAALSKTGRPSMEEAWRYRDYLAAADGNRVHLAYGYDAIDTVRYLDERRDTPPNVEYVIDWARQGSMIAEITLGATTLKTLKGLAGLKEPLFVTIKATSSGDGKGVKLNGVGQDSGLRFELALHAEQVFAAAEITVRLDHLSDSVAWCTGHWSNSTIDLLWNPEGRAGSPLVVRAPAMRFEAIISPVK